MPPFCETHQAYWHDGVCPVCAEEGAPPNAGVFEGPIPAMLFRMQERAQEAEARYERTDRALAALERHFSLELARGNRLVSAGMVLDLLGSVGMYGACGLKGRAVADLLADFEAECRP